MLAGGVGAESIRGTWAEMLPMLMMRPERCRFIILMASRLLEKDAGEVDVQDLLPRLKTQLVQRTPAEDAGVVD